jgi:ATP-dependent Clp endopeptidase proteolytic subunit ClpP
MYTLSKNAGKGNVKTDDSDSESSVETSGSKIFYYSEVSKDSVLELNKQLIDLSNKLRHSANVYDIPCPPLRLHINSPGGSLLDGLAAVDYIKQCKAPVHTIIDGSAASAATLMSVVGQRRFMHKHSFMLIHQLSSGMFGKYEELVDDFENSTKLMEVIKKIYKQHTKIPDKTLKELLKRDLWLDSATCLKYGLVDEIL